MAQKNYAFLDGMNNEALKSEIISHIESYGIDDSLIKLIDLLPERNKEKFATWRANQELMTQFLSGLNDNMKKNLVRCLEDGNYAMADQLSECMPDENMRAYQQYVATIKANNTAATTAKNLSDSLGSTAFPFLDGQDDNTKNILTGLINQGDMEKADQLASVLLSSANQKAYQQWKQRPRTTNLFFLDGLDQNSKALLAKCIEDGDMSKADQLSTILLSAEKLVLYRQWRSQNAENLPFLKGIDNNLRELMIKAIKENNMTKADGLSVMLEGEQLQLYQKWKKEKNTLPASNTPGAPLPSPRTNAPTANKKRPAFLNNIEESMAGYCEGLIEKEDFTTLDIIMSEQSPVTQEEYNRWKTEQEKKLPFLKYKNPLNKIIEDLIEKEGASAKVTQLVKSLSPEEQKLYEVWKAKQVPKFIDAVPADARELVKRNLAKTPGEAMSILRLFPEAIKQYEQWTKEGNQLQSSPTPPDTPIRGNTTPSKTRPASYASFDDPEDGPSVTTDIKRRPSQRVPEHRHNLSDVESDDGEHNEDVSSEEENQDVELDPSGFISHIESYGIDDDLINLIQFLPERNKEKFATWRANQNLSDSLGSTSFSFLDDQGDDTKNMLTGLINKGDMEKADQLASVLLSPLNQKAYQQWKQRLRPTNLSVLDELDENSKVLLTKCIEGLISVVPDRSKEKFATWRTNQDSKPSSSSVATRIPRQESQNEEIMRLAAEKRRRRLESLAANNQQQAGRVENISGTHVKAGGRPLVPQKSSIYDAMHEKIKDRRMNIKDDSDTEDHMANTEFDSI